MLKLNPHVMVGNGQNSKSFIINLILDFRDKDLQKLVLKQNYGQHRMLKSILMTI